MSQRTLGMNKETSMSDAMTEACRNEWRDLLTTWTTLRLEETNLTPNPGDFTVLVRVEAAECGWVEGGEEDLTPMLWVCAAQRVVAALADELEHRAEAAAHERAIRLAYETC